ncbi:polysaccharide deacetylase family protein [Streptomyces sp. NPDC086023]|uniref:polysaccharide deacetylase family protein n=1 Tax=Streptomyces sp. NPDC086023 TaxID=3365746 RepID=UPI0037D68E81
MKMAKIRKPKYTNQAVVVASAVALAAAVWGATEITASEAESHGGTRPVVHEKGPQEDKNPAAPPALKQVPQGIAHAPQGGGDAVNVTIDDGPDPAWTPKVLEVLKEHQVKAVFCMVGPQAQAYPGLVRRVVAEGHRLCDHTMSHDTGMDKKPVAYQEKEILDAKKLIEQAAGGTARVDYYRAPGGAFTPDSRRIAAANGMRPLGWNVDTKDFEKPGVAAIMNNIHQELPKKGGTVLFHDGGGSRGQTVTALDRFLGELKEQGRKTDFPVRDKPGS